MTNPEILTILPNFTFEDIKLILVILLSAIYRYDWFAANYEGIVNIFIIVVFLLIIIIIVIMLIVTFTFISVMIMMMVMMMICKTHYDQATIGGQGRADLFNLI